MAETEKGGTPESVLLAPALWDPAGWEGLAFSYREDQPPFVSFVFRDDDAGKRLLSQLRGVLGPVDQFNVLRVAFIEGDIPGERPGYTVHLTPNLEGIQAKAASTGAALPSQLMMVNRFKRIYTSRSLAKFKEAYAAHQRYFIGPASLATRTVHFNIAIEKRAPVFKDVSAIVKGDIDELIFVRDKGSTRH
jgi:hypothetical protein